MKSIILPCSIVLLLLACTLVSFAHAADLPRYSLGGEVVQGGNPGFAKAGGDTINLMAASDDPTNEPGEPAYDGDFEDPVGNPDWNGWTHRDLTQAMESTWIVSNYNQPDPLNHAAWCGYIGFPSCDGDVKDPAGGYGNNWHSVLEFRQTVPHTSAGTTVSVTATLIHDTEPGYDYCYLSYWYDDQSYGNIQSWDGAGTVAVSGAVSYLPHEYVDGTDIVLFFRFTSDGGWSDEDCSYPSSGACQIDDINVNLVNDSFVGDFFEDFEHGGVPDDFGIWEPSSNSGVGDFAKIWTGLEDVDPCATNYSPQVAFIDDGIVVPGTGGSHCITWCYGPGGYIVTTTGGLVGDWGHIHNAIESPVMGWPPAKTPGDPVPDGINLAFSVFVHEDLSADTPGIFYTWGVRSADTDGSAGNGVHVLSQQAWQDRNYVYYGGPEYRRDGYEVTDLMFAGRDSVQVQLAVYQLGWIWYWNGNDGYPAPYFDNVTVKVYPVVGPAMNARDIDLAQDNFPERGSIDWGDLGSHSVRFDMANNISIASHLRNDPGDSIVVDVVPSRSGAGLDGPPLLHYFLDPNPLFDSYRTAGLPAVGSTVGMPAVGSIGLPKPGKWAFDLPDTGFLFPGDVLHYFISGTDAIGGPGGFDPQTALLPPDTTGFSTGFGLPQGYDPLFTLRALPTISGDKDVYWPFMILFINDGANEDSLDKWYQALDLYGLSVGVRDGYDVYHVNGPSSGVGNGIGGRATPALLSEYTDILYTSGDLEVLTIANGDFNTDAGDDVGTLTGWINQGEKDIFLAGDGLAGDLDQSGLATVDFLNNYLGVRFVTSNVRPLIANQAAPVVQPVGGDQIFRSISSWVAYGGCPNVNRFDAVESAGTGVRSAEFLHPAGYPGMYSYSAVTRNSIGTNKVISMPMDLGFIFTDSGSGIPAHITVLADIMWFMGIPGPIGDAPGDLPRIAFQADSHPNPFNPRTTIRYSLPQAGHLKLSIYNVRGQLVKTLIDGPRPAGANQTIVWDGTDNLGSAAASGVYFFDARTAGESRIGKMTLLK